jgi:hypothetical protein
VEVRALPALCLLSLIPTAARADCAPQNLFDEIDQATTVVVGRVAPGRTRLGGPARVRVERVFKGTARGTLAVSFNVFHSNLQGGQRYLLFIGPDGNMLPGCTTVPLARTVVSPGAERDLADAVARWLAVPPAGRTHLLVEIAAGRPGIATGDAARRLAASPALVQSMTATDEGALVQALERPAGEDTTSVAMVLARRHATAAIPLLLPLLDGAQGRISGRLIEDALELLANHHATAYERGRDFYDPVADTIRADWSSWWARRQGLGPLDLLRAGFRERGVTPPALDDRNALAAAIAHAPDDLTAAEAIEICERLRGAQTSVLPRAQYHERDEAPQAAHDCGDRILPHK